jgi:DNA polymerase-3 subunit alpha
MSKQGNPWAAVTLEDMEGSVEIMFFGETYLAYSTVLAEDAVIVVRGRVRRRDDAMQLQAMEVSLPDLSAVADAPVTVRMSEARCTPPVLERLLEVLKTHPGMTEIHFRVARARGGTALVMPRGGWRVERSPALYGDLKALLGPGCLESATTPLGV